MANLVCKISFSISSKLCGRFVGSSSRSITPSRQSRQRCATLFHSAIKCVVTRTVLPRSRFEAQRFLETFAPAGIETQSRLVEQKNGRIGQQQAMRGRAAVAFHRRVLPCAYARDFASNP